MKGGLAECVASAAELHPGRSSVFRVPGGLADAGLNVEASGETPRAESAAAARTGTVVSLCYSATELGSGRHPLVLTVCWEWGRDS